MCVCCVRVARACVLDVSMKLQLVHFFSVAGVFPDDHFDESYGWSRFPSPCRTLQFGANATPCHSGANATACTLVQMQQHSLW